MADAVDAAAVAKCLIERFAQHDGCVFDRMVVVDPRVTCSFDRQVKQPVNCKSRKHVRQKPTGVSTVAAPEPSRLRSIAICVSFVLRFTLAERAVMFVTPSLCYPISLSASTNLFVSCGRPALMRMQLSTLGLAK